MNTLFHCYGRGVRDLTHDASDLTPLLPPQDSDLAKSPTDKCGYILVLKHKTIAN